MPQRSRDRAELKWGRAKDVDSEVDRPLALVLRDHHGVELRCGDSETRE